MKAAEKEVGNNQGAYATANVLLIPQCKVPDATPPACPPLPGKVPSSLAKGSNTSRLSLWMPTLNFIHFYEYLLKTKIYVFQTRKQFILLMLRASTQVLVIYIYSFRLFLLLYKHRLLAIVHMCAVCFQTRYPDNPKKMGSDRGSLTV